MALIDNLASQQGVYPAEQNFAKKSLISQEGKYGGSSLEY